MGMKSSLSPITLGECGEGVDLKMPVKSVGVGVIIIPKLFNKLILTKHEIIVTLFNLVRYTYHE